MAFSPDGTRLVSSSDDGTVRLWELAQGTAQLLPGGDASATVAFSPDGAVLAWCPRDGIALHHLERGTTATITERAYYYPPPFVLFAPDSRFLLHAHREGIRRVDVATRTVSAPWAGSEGAVFLAATADGKVLASGHSYFHHPHLGTGQEVRLLDPLSGEPRARWRVFGPYLSGVAISPGEKWVAATCGPTLHVWDVNQPERMVTRQIDLRHYFTGLAFSPDGRLLAVGRNDRTVYVWDTATWESAACYDWKIGNPTAVAFSPDGMRAAAGGNYGKIVVWDVDH